MQRLFHSSALVGALPLLMTRLATAGPQSNFFSFADGSKAFLVANGNGIVDAATNSVWRDHLGASLGLSTGASFAATAAVPEPATIVLAAVALLVILAHIRRRQRRLSTTDARNILVRLNRSQVEEGSR
jgi:hypothetical protein